MSARPRHPAQDGEIVEAYKKNFARTLSAHLADLPRGTPVEIWFQDEARIEQKNGIVRQWARRGTRPRQPADQCHKSAYLFGAICPARGTGAALALPFADTEAVQLHLDKISRHVAPGAHAVLLLDRAAISAAWLVSALETPKCGGNDRIGSWRHVDGRTVKVSNEIGDRTIQAAVSNLTNLELQPLPRNARLTPCADATPDTSPGRKSTGSTA